MIGKMLRLCLRSAVCVLIFILPAYLNASASTESCRISGQILDPQSAPVAGANLTLANAAGTLVRQTKSDQQGKFVFEHIDEGEYQPTAEATSFVSVVQNISIASGREKERNRVAGTSLTFCFVVQITISADSNARPTVSIPYVEARCATYPCD